MSHRAAVVQALTKLNARAESKVDELRGAVRALRSSLMMKQKQLDLTERTVARLSGERCASEVGLPPTPSPAAHGRPPQGLPSPEDGLCGAVGENFGVEEGRGDVDIGLKCSFG